jgi:membrane protein
MASKYPKFQQLVDETRALLEDRAPQGGMTLGRLQRVIHFWILVGRSFVRNRCPIRASALSYLTMLSLVPMLAVVVSITSTFLKQEGEEKIDQFVVKMVASVTPPDMMSTNVVTAATNRVEIPEAVVATSDTGQTNAVLSVSPDAPEAPVATSGAATNEIALPKFAQAPDAIRARRELARNINHFIQNTRSGALGVTGSIFLIFTAISLLSRIEDTFNDIWGVTHGRSWFMRIVLYWGVISLVPLFLVLALGLASGPHFEGTRSFVTAMPFLGYLTFKLLPLALLCLTFAAVYMLMPNTKVHWKAALVGGLVGGGLFFLNNMLSVLYVSRVVTNSRIYGSLGLVPVFMVGMYLTWLILLLGAQVAYAWQNRATYFEEKQVENINQRGREFVALRLATLIGQYYLAGMPPPTATELSFKVGIPTRLVRRTMQTLIAARLIVETVGSETGYLPARPLETITCHDILQAMRACEGKELATREEPTRSEVFGEFERIQMAERQAAASVTMLTLAHRAQRQLEASEAQSAQLS